jgi:hypothetical protein
MFRVWVFFAIKPLHLFEHHKQMFDHQALWCLKATCINNSLRSEMSVSTTLSEIFTSFTKP